MVNYLKFCIMSKTIIKREFAMSKVAISALVGLMCFATTSHANVADTYKKTCGTCHDTGALNAPKKGDKATWDKLKAQKGMDTLIKSTRQGMPQMPAKGLCQTCSDEDFRSLIEYMAK